MAEFLVPANILFGESSGSQAGIGSGLGQAATTGSGAGSIGVDAIPNTSSSALGQVGTHSISFGASDADGDDANKQPAAFRRAVNELAIRGSGGVVVNRNGQNVTAANCAAVFAGASLRYWISPSDVGISPGNIPATPATLQLSQLAGHPSVFVRRTQNFRGLFGQQPSTNPASPLVAIQQAVVGACPVEVFTVNRPPEVSTWALSIDGVSILCGFRHPVGSNLVRPLDIWNAVVAPALANVGSNLGAITLLQVAIGLTNVFTERGLITRLQWCEYARFVAPFDAVVAGMLTTLYPP